MVHTPPWMKKLGGYAGELFVSAEPAKRAIPNALLPENFSDDDILVGNKEGSRLGYIQVKACHPDGSKSFLLTANHENWVAADEDSFCTFVWLGKPATNEPPSYWMALKKQVGIACIAHPAHGTPNWERRFFAEAGPGRCQLPPEWRNRWNLLDRFRPVSPTAPARFEDDANPG